MIPLQRADDPHGNGLPHAKRVADGEHHIAYLGALRMPERDSGDLAGQFDLDHGKICFRIGSNDMRLGLAAICQRDFDLVGSFHHMMVGKDVAVRADDHARAQAGAVLRLKIARVAEEKTETRVIHERMDRSLDDGAGKDVHHAGHGFFRGGAQSCRRDIAARFLRRTFMQSDYPATRRARQQLRLQRLDDEQQRQRDGDGLGE